MAPDPVGLLLAALDETRAQATAPEQERYRASLAALAADLRGSSGDRARILADFPWIFFRDGIEIVALSCPGGGDAAAALLRYRPGASVPRHLHMGDEHIVVLAGSQQDERGRHVHGTATVNPAGSSHSVISPEGCIVGIVWDRPVRFLAAGS